MILENDGRAFGAPGTEPRWTRSTKEGIGTAYHTSCRVWFTLSHGIINEIYYPNVDCPNTRDLQFLITDGETFCHEERRDLQYQIVYPESNALFYRLTSTESQGRYQIIKDIITDPHLSVFLMFVRFEIKDKSLRNKLQAYALLAPHVKGLGQHNDARFSDVDGRNFFHIQREDIHMTFGAVPDFKRRSVGYVGYSDGWQDLMTDFKMNWEFREAIDGNLAVMGEVDLSQGNEVLLGIGFGHSPQSSSTKLLQSLAAPFANHRDQYVRQWKRTTPSPEWDLKAHTLDEGGLYRLSRLILLAHEDKIYPGALVASMSIPWGETKGDADLGGYHLVWTRDMVKSASALLATGQTGTPLRSLIWLTSMQGKDGLMPQNSWINGDAYWHGKQLDEVAAPILLAWRLEQAKALGLFDPWTLVWRAASYLILNGPITGQERWEENSGYSPSTLATIIAALVCAAELAAQRLDNAVSDFILDYADWLTRHLEGWLVTNCGELVPGKPRHYIRITPADTATPEAKAAPDTAMIQIANGGGLHPARNVVSTDFLELVRLGIKAPDDPIICDTIEVIDQVLKYDLPQGPCWRRYNHDGYGQKADGSAFDGEGIGRCWPLLTGERGHYELAAGKDPMPYLECLERFANEGGMLPEQVWDEADLKQAHMKCGQPTGSAMPLCWAHAEYLMLARSRKDGKVFECPEPVHKRYASGMTRGNVEIWTLAHQLCRIQQGEKLRIVTAARCVVRWSTDNWSNITDACTSDAGLNLWYVELPTAEMPILTQVDFTIKWPDRWEGRNFRVEIV